VRALSPKEDVAPGLWQSEHRVRSGFLLAILVLPVGVAAVALACASGGSSGQPGGSDGGDESSLGDGPVEGAEGASGDSGAGDGPGVSASQGCQDYVAGYCTQLATCSQFLLQVQYGDALTCQAQLLPLCNDLAAAPGTGWTGAGLEACLAAHNKQSCSDFLYAKPLPKDCRPTGTLSNTACRYDAQCGTGYCSIPAGAACGNCISRGTTGALCTSASDCDGDLMCNGMGRCAAPSIAGLACDPSSPCASGLVCIGGRCAAAAGDGGTCDQDAAANACDYNLGYYCSGTSCTPITVTMSTGCGGSPPAVCFASAYCSSGFCTPPTQDGQPCDGGVSCAAPSTCNAGTCGLVLAATCK